MTVYAQAGAISTGIYNGNWTDERPTNFRQGVAKYYPNGKMPLTALTSQAAVEAVNDPQFTYWEEEFPDRQGTIEGVYTTSDLSTTAYTTGGVAGTTLYLKMTDVADGSTFKQFRAGHTVMLLNTSDYKVMKRAKVIASESVSSTVSRLTVRLLEADNSSGNKINTATLACIIGNANPELSERPDSIMYRPTKYTNYTQIARTPVKLSRTVMNTSLRTEDVLKKAKADGIESHGVEWEQTLLFGVPYETTGTNGLPERYTMGLFYFINTYAPSNIFDFCTETDSAFQGKTWASGAGRQWLNERLEVLFRQGRTEKLAVCGSGALLGINEIVQSSGDFQFNTKTIAYGTNVVEWVTPFGTIYLKTHPLFSFNAAFRKCMLITEPQNIKWRPLKNSDTKYVSNEGSERKDVDGLDGTVGDWLTEGGFELHHASAMGIMYNVGNDNTLAS